jgi:phosphoribosylformylglycinamidine cyclo-ligase
MHLAPGDRLPGEDISVADALLAPHLSYLPALEPLLEQDLVHGMAHITGGGFYDNIPRVLPKGLDVVVKAGAWPVLPVFEVIGREGRVSFEEMHRVFNMGIGMVVFVAAADLPRVAKIWTDARRRWFAIGNVKAGRGRVLLERPPS